MPRDLTVEMLLDARLRQIPEIRAMEAEAVRELLPQWLAEQAAKADDSGPAARKKPRQ